MLYHIPLFQTDFFEVNYLSLKKAGYDLKNYADRVEFFFLSDEVDNIFRDQRNSSRHKSAEFNNCFMFITNVSKFLRRLSPRRHSSKLLLIFLARFQDIFSKTQITSMEQYVLRFLLFLPFSLQKLSYFVFG